MSTEKIITLIVAIIAAAAIIFMGARFVTKAMESSFTSTSLQKLENDYTDQIAQETDVNTLVERGMRLTQGNVVNCGIINLKRATELDKNDRDAWLWLGIAQLKSNQPQEALQSLSTAEKLDPINATTYQYLVIAYKQVGDTNGEKKAQEKYEYLTKQK